MTTYKIVRFYTRTLRHSYSSTDLPGLTGLTLEEAQAYCRDPETSSRTCTTEEGKARTDELGHWFDGYTEE